MNRIELDNRKTSVKILRIRGWDVMPVENKAHPGTPDLNACKEFPVSNSSMHMPTLVGIEIWIEFKIVEEWPKKTTTAVKINHFNQNQKSWLRSRIKINPNCFIIVQIEEEHFLYTVTPNVIDCLGTSWTQQQMYRQCNAVCKNLEEILDSLEKGIENEYKD